MHIFCRETQAHLDLNPHLVSASSSSNLITPELWLKNCKSRSASPTETERSGSPNPDVTKTSQEKEPPLKTQKSPLPLITIAPTAKLMKQKRVSEDPSIQKSPESKKDTRNKMNLRKRRTSKCSATVTSQSQSRQRTSTPKAQDLRMCSPSEGSSPASTIGTAINSPPHQINQHPPPPPFPNPMFSMPPPFMDSHHMNDMRHPMAGSMFPPRMPFMPRHMPMHERPRLPPPLNFPQPLGQPPPVTVLVPYPVIFPIPIPIPIPMPLSAFVQAHCSSKVKTETKTDETEGPLDFTMNHRRDDIDTNFSNNQPVQIEPETAVGPTSEIDDRIEVERNDDEATATETVNENEPEQTLPKFKITRLGNKMAKIVAKTREPSESSRPLRKRRRLVEATEDDALIPKTRKIVQV